MARSSPRSSIRTLTSALEDANRSRFSASSLPDNPAPMMAIRLVASSFSPRLVVLLVVVLKAQVVPRRLRRPVTVLLAAKTYANDALKRAITVAFCIFRTENPILRIIDPALTPILFLNTLSPAIVS